MLDEETYSLLELVPLLQGQRVRLGNDGNDIDDLGKLLEYHDIDLMVSVDTTHQQQADIQASRCVQ